MGGYDERVCPIVMAGLLARPDGSLEDARFRIMEGWANCKGESCAWWVHEEAVCAVKATANNTDRERYD